MKLKDEKISIERDSFNKRGKGIMYFAKRTQILFIKKKCQKFDKSYYIYLNSEIQTKID